MSDLPTRSSGPSGDQGQVPGRELVLAGAVDPDIDAFLGHGAEDELTRRVRLLAEVVRALGLVSVGLGVASAVFIWPKVHLLRLIVVLALAVSAAGAGLVLRAVHRRAVRRLPRDPRAHRRLKRTKAHRCHAGLALAAVMFGSGLLIRQAELAAAARRDSEADSPIRPDLVTGFNRARADAMPPGKPFVSGDLRLRIESVEIRSRPNGRALVLTLVFRNSGTTRKLDLDELHDVRVPLMRASLFDDLANPYDALDAPTIVADTESDTAGALYPGEALRARLVFEPPVARARALLLRIPENAFTLPRDVKFEIDATALNSESERESDGRPARARPFDREASPAGR